MAVETNSFILAGTHERVFVSELAPGDVLVWGETVKRVERASDNRTVIYMTNGQVSVYGKAGTTVLIEKK